MASADFSISWCHLLYADLTAILPTVISKQTLIFNKHTEFHPSGNITLTTIKVFSEVIVNEIVVKSPYEAFATSEQRLIREGVGGSRRAGLRSSRKPRIRKPRTFDSRLLGTPYGHEFRPLKSHHQEGTTSNIIYIYFFEFKNI